MRLGASIICEMRFPQRAVRAEPIELVTQVYLDIPQRDEQPAVGLFTGIIVTMPSVRRDLVAEVH